MNQLSLEELRALANARSALRQVAQTLGDTNEVWAVINAIEALLQEAKT